MEEFKDAIADFVNYVASGQTRLTDLIVVLLFVGLVSLAFWPKRKKRDPPTVPDALDSVLYWWNQRDSFSVRDLLAGGVHALGRTSSGKTSGLRGLAFSIVEYRNSSLLVMCAKRNEHKDWLAYAAEAGRSEDVVLIDLRKDWRFNMVGYEAEREGDGAGQVSNVTRFIMELRSVIFRESKDSSGDHQEWIKQDERCISNAVTILMQAREPVTPANLHRLITGAPISNTQVSSETWKEGYCNQMLRKAFGFSKGTFDEHDYGVARDYFTEEWPAWGEKTRGSVLIGTIGTLTAMNTGMARELFAETTNITPQEMIEGRKIVIVNMPPDEYGDLGLIANCGLKYHWQNEVLRREITNDSPIACIWGDESSMWVTASDAKFLSRCRSYRGCMVYLCQSLNSYRAVLPGEKAEAEIQAMLGNMQTKLMFALGDHATAEWAANLVGKELQQFAGGSVCHPEGTVSLFQKDSHVTASFSEHWENIIQPGAFMNGLRTGGASNDCVVDAVLVRSGMPFSNGLPYITVSFDQRRY